MHDFGKTEENVIEARFLQISDDSRKLFEAESFHESDAVSIVDPDGSDSLRRLIRSESGASLEQAASDFVCKEDDRRDGVWPG